MRSSDLVRRLATVTVHVKEAQGPCYSAGDALREIESYNVIKSDFVLVPGDVVANVALGPLIAAHKKRRETDREAVITTVMKRLSPEHASRRADERMLVALSGETGRLLMYEDVNAHPEWTHKLRVPTALLQDTDCLQLHRDLYDTHIDICTPELLVLVQARAVAARAPRLHTHTPTPPPPTCRAFRLISLPYRLPPMSPPTSLSSRLPPPASCPRLAERRARRIGRTTSIGKTCGAT